VELDDTVCYCFHISKRKILNYLRVHQPRRASQLTGCGGAGTGCGWCVSYLQRYFQEGQAGAAQADAITANDYAQQRAAYIRAGKGKPAAGAIPLPEEEIPRDKNQLPSEEPS
jgi:bacterioferritin-associated ferredoxin